MTGRGVDQIMAHPCSPVLHEAYLHSALDYVHLAEEASGTIPRHVDGSYIWGAALEEWKRTRPDVRIINLETSVTRNNEFFPKGINYRMSPENADCLTAASIDCCVLANNHVIDWGYVGLLDTLATLEGLHIKTAGAGRNLTEAAAPAVLHIVGDRVLVFAFALPTSGTPRNWAAEGGAPGVNLLADLTETSALRVAEHIALFKEPGDMVIVSVHWGPNWGYQIPDDQQRFAHMLIDRCDVSIIHGHSSHHAKAIEVYRNRLILYGCGDFVNDYEGIGDYEEYRDDLALMYFVDVDVGCKDITALEIVPLEIKRFRLSRPVKNRIDRMQRILSKESAKFGIHISSFVEGKFVLSW
jgi:poly-gamma-glutamate synthesis protein (capsule biosynthesis protein)